MIFVGKYFFTFIAEFYALSSVKAKIPNAVYIFTDQQNDIAMSCAGNPTLSTPNFFS